MPDFDFWRDLGEIFRKLDPEGVLQARWTIVPLEDQALPLWEVFGTDDLGPSKRAQFVALATRAGLKLDGQASAPMDLWLNAIKAEAPQIEFIGPSGVSFQECGHIKSLCRVSADLCSVLEARALMAEHGTGLAAPTQSDALVSERDEESTDDSLTCYGVGGESSSQAAALSIGEKRREQIDTFLKNCNAVSSRRISRSHIWRMTGHSTARQFEYWQSANKKASPADNRNFLRVLQMAPQDFLAALKRKGLLQ